ncbi:hypothetical protein SFRURICE_011991, partial [Spodoptera frugiperda]
MGLITQMVKKTGQQGSLCKSANKGSSPPDQNLSRAYGASQIARPPQMGPSRADARPGAADYIAGYRGSGSKSKSRNGVVFTHLELLEMDSVQLCYDPESRSRNGVVFS